MKLEVKFKRFRRKCIVYIRQQYKGKDGSQPFEDWKLEDLFQAIMQYGCKYDISKHIAGHQGKATAEAGRINRGKGADKGSGTRSSLMWETM